jgi:bacterioferritin-associated ferredoxin
MYVCICHGVTEQEICAEISGGACTEEEIGDRCGAGTGCGMCVDKICALLRAPRADRGKIGAEAII